MLAAPDFFPRLLPAVESWVSDESSHTYPVIYYKVTSGCCLFHRTAPHCEATSSHSLFCDNGNKKSCSKAQTKNTTHWKKIIHILHSPPTWACAMAIIQLLWSGIDFSLLIASGNWSISCISQCPLKEQVTSHLVISYQEAQQCL